MSSSFPVSKDLGLISCMIVANSLCKVCRTMGLNLSGPAALCGFKPTSRLYSGELRENSKKNSFFFLGGGGGGGEVRSGDGVGEGE